MLHVYIACEAARYTKIPGKHITWHNYISVGTTKVCNRYIQYDLPYRFDRCLVIRFSFQASSIESTVVLSKICSAYNLLIVLQHLLHSHFGYQCLWELRAHVQGFIISIIWFSFNTININNALMFVNKYRYFLLIFSLFFCYQCSLIYC